MKTSLFPATLLAAAFFAATAALPVQAQTVTIEVGASQDSVNVMKRAMPKLPSFAPLKPKPGFVRGWVKDSSGKPLAGAKIGVRSSAGGGFYSGASGKTDARGYYEIQVPWGAAHYYCAGYTVDYGDGRAALGLHPADGEADSFASAKGAVENWVLLNYGIADPDGVSENPSYANNYYGGSFYLDFQVADARPAFADDYSLPDGSEIELTLTPKGRLLDGTSGQTFVFHKKASENERNSFKVNNIPIGVYTLTASLVNNGETSALRLKETGPYSNAPFGLDPKEARGEVTLTFRPQGAKPESALGQHGNWESLSITLKK
jgi:hypothetical protein